ncbi:MAG: DUF6382 domain-containing protein [Lachnospiraceae bacterium]|nr:DUF6382 domain-containing protein [Lachnospiraceae bacterium]
MPERKNLYAEKTFFQKSGDKSYLVIRSKEAPELPYQINMIKYNNITGLLPVQFFIEDGEYRYFYDISCRESIADRMKQKRYSIQEIRTVMSCLYRCVQKLEEYLLDTDCLILDPEYIFTEKDCFNIQFCFYQDKKETFEKSLEKLFDYFLNQLDYQDEKTVILMYSLYQKSREENVSLYELMKQFCEIPKVEKERKTEKSVSERDGEDNGDTADDRESVQDSVSLKNRRCRVMEEKHLKKRIIPYIPDVIGGYGIARILLYISRHHAQMSGKAFMLWMFAVAGILAVCGIFSTFLSGIMCKKLNERDDKQGQSQKENGLKEENQKKYEQISWESYRVKVQEPEKKKAWNKMEQKKCEKESCVAEDRWENISELDSEYENKENCIYDEFCFEADSEKTAGETAGTIPATVIMSEPELFRAHNPVLISKDKEKFHDIILKDREMMIGKVRGIADVCLEGRSISRVHARVSQDQEGCSVTDLGSTNGTFINGTRLDERQKKYLQQGDEVRFAEAVFIFQTEESEIIRSQQLSDVI